MYCGKACSGCVEGCMNGCRTLGPCCNSITNCIGKGCGAVDAVCCPPNKPKPIFMWYAILMAIPTILYSVIGIIADEPMVAGIAVGDCEKVQTWLLVGLILAVVNICFGIYIYLRFASMIKKKAADAQAGGVRQKKPMERRICGSCFDSCGVACELFCYDVGVFFYLAFYIGVIVFVAIADEKHCGDKSEALDTVKLLWIIFLVGAICVLCVSLTCEVTRDDNMTPPPAQVVGQGGVYYPVGTQPVVQHPQPGYPAQAQPQYPQGQAQPQAQYAQAPVQPAAQQAYPQQVQQAPGAAQAQYPARAGEAPGAPKTNAEKAGELVGNAGAKFGAFLTGKK